MYRSLFIMTILTTLAIAASGQGTTDSQTKKAQIAELAWMAGCWEMNNTAKGLRIEEQWTAPGGGTMFGVSRTIRGEKTTGFEFMRIVADEVSLKLISKPSQNIEETPFRIAAWTNDSVTFANPAHDFPQRIIYQLAKDGKLNAAIEGTSNGKVARIDFPYERVKCP